MGHCGHSECEACEKDGKAMSHEEANTTDERIAALEKTVALLVKRDRFTSSRIAYLEGLPGEGE